MAGSGISPGAEETAPGGKTRLRHHGFFDGRFACGNFPAHQLFQVGLVVQQRAEATAYERAAHLGAVGQRRNAEGQRDEPDQSQHHRFGRRRFQKTAWLQHEKTGEGAGGQKAVTEAEGGKGAHTVALGDVGVHDPQARFQHEVGAEQGEAAEGAVGAIGGAQRHEQYGDEGHEHAEGEVARLAQREHGHDEGCASEQARREHREGEGAFRTARGQKQVQQRPGERAAA